MLKEGDNLFHMANLETNQIYPDRFPKLWRSNLLACWDKGKEAVRGGGFLNTHSAVCEHSAAEIDAQDRPELFTLLSLFK